jgi:GST-like protein
MFGQLGFFTKFAGKDIEDKRPLERYRDESKRLLQVLETRMTGRDWVAGNAYSIADIAIVPWIRTLRDFYGAGDMVGLNDCKHVLAWVARVENRPAFQKGLTIPARG